MELDMVKIKSDLAKAELEVQKTIAAFEEL